MASDSREKMLKNFRGRRILACNAEQTLHSVIENLGVDDGSQIPLREADQPAVPADAVKLELKNAATNLLRLILAHNDGGCSPDYLKRF